MAELLNQIFSLSKAEQLQLMAAMIDHLRDEEVIIPSWQQKLAKDALNEVETNPSKLILSKDFWDSIDAKLEELENNAQ